MLPKIKTITIAFFAITLFGIIGNVKAQTQITDIEFKGYSISRSEVLTYYSMHNILRGKKTFWKFVFQFKLIDGNPKTMGLVCYALNRPKKVIDNSKAVKIANTVLLNLETSIPIVSAVSPVILGNLELTRKQIDSLIGKRRNPYDFKFIYIKPLLNESDNQILYKAYTDLLHVDGDKAPPPVLLNPCPPGQPY